MARPYLGNPKYTIEVLQKYNFAFQKRFGHVNFLFLLNYLIIICKSHNLVHRFRNNYTTHLSVNPIAQV